jgi:hypothetical protein
MVCCVDKEARNGDRLFVETASLKSTIEGVDATMLVQLRDARTRYDASDEVRSIVRIEYVDCSNRRIAAGRARKIEAGYI